ncbi:MAG TPA: hypothetical protein VNO55_23965 [Polyangia bacterium]|nr:hypothetical protein [Polyangia bacterium]
MAIKLPRTRCLTTALLMIFASRAAMAQSPAPDGSPPAASGPAVVLPTRYGAGNVPSHLTFENQVYDASVSGLRTYLEAIRFKDAQLYAALDPELQRLEARHRAAVAVFLVGVGAGIASTIYAFAGRDNCPMPSLNDPNFQGATAAWGACNDANMRKTATFGLIGVGSMVAGLFGASVIAPGRSDLFDFVNRQNSLNREPLRLQIGFDPVLRLASAGASVTF